jgi:hypothetical protein
MFILRRNYEFLNEHGLIVPSQLFIPPPNYRFIESIDFLGNSLKITVLKDGNILLIFKDVRYMYPSQFRYNCYNSLQIFVESNIVVLHSGMMFTSFVFENDAFSKIGDYSVGNFICGGILTLVGGTPYFVGCIHPRNSKLSVVVIDLRTGQLNTVLKMGENEHFDSFISLPDGKIVMNTWDEKFEQSKTLIDTNPWKYVFNKTLKKLLEKFTKQ